MVTADKKLKSTFDTLPDAREDDNGKLSDTNRLRTPSGHMMEFNDVNGKEHVTIQHRSGTMFQMQPDGSLRIVSQNGKMGIEVNGEGYMKITGVYNLVVNGDAGFRIDGDADWHVAGDMRTTVDGTYSIAAKNMTTSIKEKYELTAADLSMHTASNSVFTAGNKMYLGSTNSAKIYSGDTLTVVGETKIDLNP